MTMIDPNQIEIKVWGKPVAKGRPRFARRGKFVTTYTPKKTVDFETLVKLAAQPLAPKELWKGMISAHVTIYLPIPKGFSKKKREQIENWQLRPTTRPDLDNYVKVLDALNGIIYEDDKQIVSLMATKYYADKPCLVINLRQL